MGAGASTPAPEPATAAGVCPVDHKTREAWLQQHKASGGAAPPPHPMPSEESRSKAKMQRPLSTDREVSSIPRAIEPQSQSSSPASPNAPPSPYSSPSASHGAPSNDEAETGHDPNTGNWIYPSERQFFEALMRKGNTPSSTESASELATTVASIIPIHNAVNERAWQQILEWESRAPSSDPGSKKCGGPKLYSFRGLGVDPQFLSPRARINNLMGYQLPFDRHDWVVERCGGERVEYVIDFYQGKTSGGATGAGLAANAGPGKLSFYLDVRPKMNTWEGCRMRFSKFAGL
ncbi:cytochrome c1 heme lyase [Aspergillus japonicus CBS 114.51]|uniref:Holocytochrome c-type synthase n=2 Tax=Aspergillus TaxID=5052 RepID=A0A2V5HJE0_ASPV1|nr:cytochrome c1 heme lyase [Aspergillus japonicus CBS 114.51]PYI22084.1 cytochrome c1 heme lyase [Aspergillus violaceofuscus CBS 115571]RAH77061.1 cytochrome c1 heme lyase [Aspergillus japonicus CBS 114.51]